MLSLALSQDSRQFERQIQRELVELFDNDTLFFSGLRFCDICWKQDLFFAVLFTSNLPLYTNDTTKDQMQNYQNGHMLHLECIEA